MDKLAEQIAALTKMVDDYVKTHTACHQDGPVTAYTPPSATQTTETTQKPQTIQTIAFPPMIVKWANAIKLWEGGPDATNPGDLKYAPLTASWGATPGKKATDGGYLAHFPTEQKGFNALCQFLLLGCHDELKAYHSARTLGSFMMIYGGNPPAGYLSGIAHALGVGLDTRIETFL